MSRQQDLVSRQQDLANRQQDLVSRQQDLANRQHDLAPFHTLVKLIERELELAGAGDVAQLRAAVAQTGEYMRELPVPPPESARVLIERARALRARVSIETQRLQESIATSRASKRRRRKVERSYAAPAPLRYSASA